MDSYERRVARRVQRRENRRYAVGLFLARRRLRVNRAVDPSVVSDAEEAIRGALVDLPELEHHVATQAVQRYADAGFAVETIDDVRREVSLRAADRLAISAKPPNAVRQARLHWRFRGRLRDEVAQLVYEALFHVVCNAAVYGYPAGAASERPFTLWLLALPTVADVEQRRAAQAHQADEDWAVRTLAVALIRAKHGAHVWTGIRPFVGDFNAWYLSRVTHESRWAYRERRVCGNRRQRPT